MHELFRMSETSASGIDGKDRWADSAGEFRSDALPTRVLYSAADQITQVDILNRRAFFIKLYEKREFDLAVAFVNPRISCSDLQCRQN